MTTKKIKIQLKKLMLQKNSGNIQIKTIIQILLKIFNIYLYI